MRDQSKAVLNTILQVEQPSRIQAVPDGAVMLCTVQWPTSDTVEDNTINCTGSMNYHLERNAEYQIFYWYIGNRTKQKTRCNRSGNDASRKNQLSLRTTRLTRTDCFDMSLYLINSFATAPVKTRRLFTSASSPLTDLCGRLNEPLLPRSRRNPGA